MEQKIRPVRKFKRNGLLITAQTPDQGLVELSSPGHKTMIMDKHAFDAMVKNKEFVEVRDENN